MFKHVCIFLVVAALLAVRVPAIEGQGNEDIRLEFTPHQSNPVLTIGETGAWDSGTVESPRVVYADQRFHMLYTGYIPQDGLVVPVIGYATSEDGISWTKHEHNPVFVPDESIAPYGISTQAVLLEGETWVIYFSPITALNMPSEKVLRATAASPVGPWTVHAEPAMIAGAAQDWDRRSLNIDTVLRTDTGYVLYYVPLAGVMTVDGMMIHVLGPGVGMAASPDGVNWTKHDDPATTTNMYAVSDPVFTKHSDYHAWDGMQVSHPVVRFATGRWEMFYAGGDANDVATGYATSEDGITWTRYGDIPIMSMQDGAGWPSSVVVLDDTYYLYYTLYMAGTKELQIGLATGTVTW